MFQRLHHVAYRCRDAQRTVDFYTKVVGLRFVAGLLPPEGRVATWPLIRPDGSRSTLQSVESSASIHIFFELGDGSYLAFFDVIAPHEVENPALWWVRHIAFEVPDMDFLLAAKKRLESHGLEVLGPKDHQICQSIYFNDPDGNRLEMAVRTEKAGMWDQLSEQATTKLAEWNERKRRLAGEVELPPPVTHAAPPHRVRTVSEH